MRKYLLPLCLLVTISGFAQQDICSSCDELADRVDYERYAPLEFQQRCLIAEDTIVLNEFAYRITFRHRCRKDVRFKYYSRKDSTYEAYSFIEGSDTIFVDIQNGTFAYLGKGSGFLSNFLAENIVYPKEAEAKGLEGTVVVLVIVSETGKISNPSMQLSIHKSLNDEAIRVISMLPDLIPATYTRYGVPCKTKMGFAVTFKLPKK